MAKRARTKSNKKKRSVKKRRISGIQKQSFLLGANARFNQIENKNVDNQGTLNIASATSTWSPIAFINGIAQGAGNGQHVGRRVVMTALNIRWVIDGTMNQTAPVRILVVYDKSPTGALPLITDILTGDSIISHVNLNNSDRFLILRDYLPGGKDGQGYMPINATANNGFAGISDKTFVKFNPGLQMQFTGTGLTIADVSCGALYLMWVTTAKATTGSGNQSMNYFARIRYTDV